MSSNIIVLKAYKPGKNPEVVCRPAADVTGHIFTGQGQNGYFEQLSPEEQRNMGYLITPQTSVKLVDGLTLNLNTPRDKANWVWLKKHPYITMEKELNPHNDAAFFVFDSNKQASERVQREKRRIEIMGYVFEKSEEDQRQLAGALGLGDTSGMTIDQVLEYIQDRVSSNPAVVEPLLADKVTVSVTSLLRDGLNRNVLKKSRGWFKFEDVNLGNGEDAAIEFLKDSQNEDVVLAIRAQIEQVQ